MAIPSLALHPAVLPLSSHNDRMAAIASSNTKMMTMESAKAWWKLFFSQKICQKKAMLEAVFRRQIWLHLRWEKMAAEKAQKLMEMESQPG